MKLKNVGENALKKAKKDGIKKNKKKNKLAKAVSEAVVVSAKSKKESQLEQLALLIKTDHVLTLTFDEPLKKSVVKEKFADLVKYGLSGGLKIHRERWTKSSAFICVEVESAAVESDLPRGSLVMGPEADQLNEVQKFHTLWGKSNCQLRRFQDGKIRESVQLGKDQPYFALSKLLFLLKHHLPEVGVLVHQFSSDLLTECLTADKTKEKLRATVDHFVNFLQALSHESSLPMRQVRAVCSCLHSGDLLHEHSLPANVNINSSKLVLDKSGYMHLKEKKAEKAPHLTQAINVLVEITVKDRLSSSLFARMRMTYVLALKALLSQNKMKCMVKRGSDLFVTFQGLLFRLSIQDPNSLLSNSPKNPWKLASLSELINRIGSPNASWVGLCQMIRRWAFDNGFELSFPDIVLDLVAASLYFDKDRPRLSSTSSIEKSFLTFLHKLAFTDFEKETIFLTAPEEFDAVSFSREFQKPESRSTFPPCCIITPFDVTPSGYTKDLDAMTLTRLVNCARKSLYTFTSHFNDVTFSGNTNVNFGYLLTNSSISSFDVVLIMKPLLIPSLRTKMDPTKVVTSTEMSSFPVVGFNPVTYFLSEARESFGNVAKFLLSRPRHSVGVKFIPQDFETGQSSTKRPAFDPSLIIEDLKVLGKGLIKDVQVNLKN